MPSVCAVVTAYRMDDLAPRRPATIASLDARLSVWGQAARDAASRRAEALVEGSVLYVERVGRNAEVLRSIEIDAANALLGAEYDPLVDLATGLLPMAVAQSCRLLWVDPDRLRERLAEALMPAIECARAEVRRRQALYRRRARLWQHDQERLNKLREELEGMKVPRCSDTGPERVACGLLERHQADAPVVPESVTAVPDASLRIRPGSIARWIAQLESKIGASEPAAVR
jgi:hypothetical protein